MLYLQVRDETETLNFSKLSRPSRDGDVQPSTPRRDRDIPENVPRPSRDHDVQDQDYIPGMIRVRLRVRVRVRVRLGVVLGLELGLRLG